MWQTPVSLLNKQEQNLSVQIVFCLLIDDTTFIIFFYLHVWLGHRVHIIGVCKRTQKYSNPETWQPQARSVVLKLGLIEPLGFDKDHLKHVTHFYLCYIG